MAFHEKAGRSQGNSGFIASSFFADKVLTPPSSHCRQQLVDLRCGWHYRALHRDQVHRHLDYSYGTCMRDTAMKKNLITAVLMTVATTLLLGIIYPLVVTGLAQLIFPKQANGQLIRKDDKVIGSSILAQGFS